MNTIIFSHIGKRQSNQDSILINSLTSDEYLMLVADGMGGYSNGDIAAKLVNEVVLSTLDKVLEIDQKEVQIAIDNSNLILKEKIESLQSKMGATVGGIVISKSNALCFWVGDVLILHFRSNKLIFESKSHTFINEMKSTSFINDPEKIKKFKHVVTRSVNGDLSNSIAEFHIIENLIPEDLLIVCSDGVHDVLAPIQIQQILNTTNNYQEAIFMIEKRLQLEANDNYSLIAIYL
jgi:protein phosphatase